MGKKKQRRSTPKNQVAARRGRSARNSPSPGPPPSGSPTAEVVTVAWMLSLLATLTAEVLGVLIRLLTWQVGATDRLQVLSGTLLIVALVAGLITLLLTPLTLKLRRTPPPRPIVVSALIAGVIPALTVVLLAFR